MADVQDFIELLSAQVNRGIYVWGANGEIVSSMSDPIAWIERHETDAKNAARAIKLFKKRVNAGVKEIRAFDCSGLVYWALRKLGLQKNDVSSRGLYALCDKISESELRAGDLVFHHDGKQIVHVGVYVGSGNYIECRGRDVGVVENKRKAGYWNRFGRWKAFDVEPTTNKYVRVLGGSVRVREGDGVGTRCIGVAHRGEEYPYLGTAPSGWHMIEYSGQSAYITNKPRYTEVVFDA